MDVSEVFIFSFAGAVVAVVVASPCVVGGMGESLSPLLSPLMVAVNADKVGPSCASLKEVPCID